MAASGIQAGATAGAAFGPWGAAVGAVAGGLMDAFGDSGGGGPAAPMSAHTAVYGNGLDGSGWNINFAGFQSNAANKPTSGVPSAAESLGLAGPGGVLSPVVIVGVVALIGLAAWSKSKK